MLIAIIGHGFVGQAISYGFSGVDQIIIDPKINSSIIDHKNKFPNFVFVSVPTPMGNDGEINATHVYSTLDLIQEHWKNSVIVIKSTITPDILRNISHKYKMLQIVYNPEFLTERSSKFDFTNPQFHVFGSNKPRLFNIMKVLYNDYSMCNPCPIHCMSLEEASFVKYGMNTYMAMKITYFNQLKDSMEFFGDCNYKKVSNVMGSISRIGAEGTKVPGFDGKRGFGGSCFPKDISAFTHFTDFSLLESVKNINKEYRKALPLDNREIEMNVKFE